MYRTAEQRINKLTIAGDEQLLQGGLKGVEKESLRISRDGSVAQSPHPQAWGSPLTHPHITTDYSEALTELVTPAFDSVDAVTGFLDQVHQFLYDNMAPDELMWAASMPCAVGDDESIPIARYGSSNVGRMKHIYRVGLDYRYGRRMQAIAGVHFNYSVPQEFWPILQEEDDDAGELRDYIDEKYFGLIRNFQRTGWLIPFLFGNSPAVCKSFLGGRTTRFKTFDYGTQYLPYATSLRMSDIGYKNKNQAALRVSYDDIDAYVNSLQKAIETPYPEYEAIGIKDGDDYVQLNTNVLQIENEFYSFVRPKRSTRRAEKPSVALRDRGVEYVEIRALDVNAFSSIGVSAEQLRFLEAFMLFCLMENSPVIADSERRAIEYNELTVALRGREPDVELQVNGAVKPLREWAGHIIDSVAVVAGALDARSGSDLYQRAVSSQRDALSDNSRLPSTQMLAAMREQELPYAKFAMQLSEKHERQYRGRRLDPETAERFAAIAANSLAEQAAIEATDDISFEEYLRRYFNETLAAESPDVA